MIHKDTTNIAVIGDVHIAEHSQAAYKDLFKRISTEADILILCGDLTNFGTVAEAKIVASELSNATIPILAVLGNHDHQSGQTKELKEILSAAKVVFLEDESFVLNEITFVGVKGYGGGFTKYMLSPFGEEATKHFVTESVNESLKLENALRSAETKKLIVALHYSPIPETLKGEPPEIFPFLGNSRLAETIDRFPVSAVFHGHAHHGTHEGKTQKGIPVYNCAADLMRALNPDQPFKLITI